MAEQAGSIKYTIDFDGLQKFNSDANTASKTFDDLGGKAKSSAEEVSSANKNIFDIAKGFAIGTVGAAAFAKGIQSIGGFVSGSINEFKEGELAVSNLNAVIEQTNKAFGRGLDVSDIQDFATELQNATGIADDAIIQSSAVLASFGGVSKSNFKQAQEAAANLSVLLKKDLQSATVQLGKALEDPKRGLAALGESGISFTESQREQILLLQQTGRQAEAQQLIVEAVYNNTGSAARKAGQTATGQLNILRERFNGIKELVGGFVLNSIVIPGIDLLTSGLKTVGDTITRIRDIFTSVRESISQFFVALQEGNALAVALAVPLGALAIVLGIILTAVTLLGTAWVVLNAGILVWNTLSAIAAGLTTALGVAFSILTSPLFLISLAIAAVIAIGYLLIKNWEEIKTFAINTWESIRSAIGTAIDSISSFITGLINKAQEFAISVANAFSNLVARVVSAMIEFRIAVSNGLDSVMQFFAQLPSRILGAMGNLGSILIDAGRAIMNGLKQGIVDGFNSVKDYVSGIADKIKSLKGPLPKDKVLLEDEGFAIMFGLNKGIQAGFERVKDTLGSITNTIANTNLSANGTIAVGSAFAGPVATTDNGLATTLSSMNSLDRASNKSNTNQVVVKKVIVEPIIYDSLNILTQEQKREIYRELQTASDERDRSVINL